MASLESLNFDSENAIHYIHCILSNIPLNLNISEIAEFIVPNSESEIVKKIDEIGFRIIPHQLQTYKEPLDTKFGFITYFLNQTSSSSSSSSSTIIINHEEFHNLILQWINEDLTKQLELLKIKITLGQPQECYSSIPFLRALNKKCLFLNNKNFVKDPKKLETFLLSKIHFITEGLNKDKNNNRNIIYSSEDNENEENSWKIIGTFHISSLTSKEFIWLNHEHKKFPPILVTNGNFLNATCDKELLRKFLKETLSPLIEVVE